VERLWVGRWDLRGEAPHVTELLGDPCVHFVFESGDHAAVHGASRAVGVWTTLWKRTLADRGEVRGVKLRAGAVRAFVDVPAASLSNRITPLSELFCQRGEELSALECKVLAPGPEQDSQALAALTAWLRERHNPQPSSDLALATALLARIAEEAELTRVEQLAALSGVHPRALQRLFRDYVGASPKWVIRRNRLQDAVVRLEEGRGASIAALAAELGYTDQAHFCRDFKSATGRSPSEFARTV
jgi:AraC-like DNA-binding protein